MAIVIKEQNKPGFADLLGQGLGQGLAAGTGVALERALKQRDEEEFQKKLRLIQGAGSKEAAVQKLISEGVASSPDELVKLTASLDSLFPQAEHPKKISTPVVDQDSGATIDMQLTADEINNPELLQRAFPDRNLRLAGKGEQTAVDWYTKDGTFIRRSAVRPKGGVPLEQVRFHKTQSAKGAAAAESDLFDEQGNLKNETTRAALAMLKTRLARTDEDGNLLSEPDPVILDDAASRIPGLLRSGQERDLLTAVPRAIREATKAHPERNRIKLSPKRRSEMSDRVFEFNEGISLIDSQIFKLGSSTGLGSAGRQLLNFVTGAASELGAKIPFPDTTRVRSALASLERGLQRTLLVNTRAPVSEQETIKGLIPSPDDWIQAPDLAAQKLRGLRDFLLERMDVSSQQLGKEPPSVKTLEQRLQDMPLPDIANIDLRILTPSERTVLRDRLIKAGYRP